MAYCTNCGAPLAEGSLFCTSCGTKIVPAVKPAPNPAEAPKPAAGPSGTAPEGYDPNWKQAAEEQKQSKPEKTNKGKNKAVKIIIAAAAALIAVILALVLLVIFVPGMRNFYMRTFSSPEKYYKYVEEKAIKETSENVADIYGNIISNMGTRDHSMDYEIEVSISDSFGAILEDYLAMAGGSIDDNMKWLEKISLSGRSNWNDGKEKIETELKLNGKKIVDMDGYLDPEEEEAYLRIPDLSDEYLLVDSRSYWNMPEIMDAIYFPDSIYEAGLDEKTTEELLSKYAEALIGEINKVEKQKKSLSAGKIEAEYTALVVKIDEKTVAKALEDVADLMEDDRKLSDIVEEACDAAGISSPSRVYDDLVDGIHDEADYLKENEDFQLKMTVWVDNKGDIRGRSFTLDGEEILRYAAPKKGDTLGFELTVWDNTSYSSTHEAYISLTGSGTEKGNKLTGDFDLKAKTVKGSYRIMSVDVKDLLVDEMKKGQPSGQITISASKDFTDFCVNEVFVSREAAVFLSGLKLNMDIASSSHQVSSTIKLQYNKDTVATVKTNLTTSGKAESFKMVDSGIDAQRYYEGLSTDDFTKILDALEDAGVPSEYIDELGWFLYYNIDLQSSSSGAAPASTPAASAASEFDPDFYFFGFDQNGRYVDETVFMDHPITMINFWEPWCGPCINEMPDLEQLYLDIPGLLIIGVNQDEDGFAEVLEETGITYPAINYDSIFDQFQTGYVPTTIFVDSAGHVLGDEPYVGSRSYEDWKDIITELLGSDY